MLLRRHSLLLAAGVAAAALTAGGSARVSALAADESAARLLPFDITETTLPNGLRVIVVPTGFPNIVSLQIPVQTGSRNEVEPGKSGFAHFFEHMMFRGTKNYPPEAYQAVVTRAGAQQNAFTTNDFTNYYTTFAKDDLEKMLEIEADRFQHLSYPEAAFRTEARAVLGEYNKNSANPVSKLFEAQRDAAFKAHTYKHTTMGFLKDIEDMPNQFEYSKAFFDRWYRPEYTTLIIAGDVKAAEVLPLVEKYWGRWQRGSYTVDIPVEPAPAGPVQTHVDWTGPTLPYVSVAFHGPAFSDTGKDWAALDLVADLVFGPTSPLYKRLVDDEQKVDQFFASIPGTADPMLFTVAARVKKADDAVYVRDAILRAAAEARDVPLPARQLADAKSNMRYSLLRGLDNTDAIASLLAQFVRYSRTTKTLENLFATYAALTPDDLREAARTYFTDARLVQTTLARDPLPELIRTVPPLASFAAAGSAATLKDPIVQQSVLPQLNVKLLFRVGSAHDPEGKEGLATLAASMIAEAGSQTQGIDDIRKAFFPMAASFTALVDKEMTTFTARVHRDNWDAFAGIALPMLTEPGFREEDFTRLKAAQKNALVQDLRTNNEEELGKEQLQADLFAGTPYAHPVLGTVAGLDAITLDDVKAFVKQAYTRAALDVGMSGDLPEGLDARLARDLAKLPEGPAMAARGGVAAKRPSGITVNIIEKDTRATAISFGHPIEVTRSHPDFAALYLARTWLGEHRSSSSYLYQRIREARGMNYGDYAYIEAFPRGMFQMLPSPNVARRAQLFEVWIRPVVPEHGHMALRIAIHELRKLVSKGMTQQDFETTRDYVMKSVFLMTATQDQRLGYALDSKWYGIGDFATYMREQLAKLTLADVNRVVKQHLSGDNLHVIVITKDAEGLRKALVADAPSPVKYDAPKPKEILAEDKVIGTMKLNIAPTAVTVTPIEDVFRQ
ncbi:MAG: insulinase family protein [Vicinamibacteraceae bacterium]|nr:insulinase family protein [Vicinamibacteraceae bacterium]